MTDPSKYAGPIQLGPLTANEWGTLFLLGDDERNPLPVCCGNISMIRDAFADVLRVGGDPQLGWLRIAPIWEDIYYCYDREEVMANPVLRKLYDAYVAGREIPEKDGEAYERFRATTLEHVRMLLDTVDGPDSLFQLDTRAGRMHALVRMAGTFVAYLVDDNERQEAALILAEKIGMDGDAVCFAVDVLRQRNDLPHRPTRETDRDVAEDPRTV